mgnify:CR=1 FL=1
MRSRASSVRGERIVTEVRAWHRLPHRADSTPPEGGAHPRGAAARGDRREEEAAARGRVHGHRPLLPVRQARSSARCSASSTCATTALPGRGPCSRCRIAIQECIGCYICVEVCALLTDYDAVAHVQRRLRRRAARRHHRRQEARRVRAGPAASTTYFSDGGSKSVRHLGKGSRLREKMNAAGAQGRLGEKKAGVIRQGVTGDAVTSDQQFRTGHRSLVTLRSQARRARAQLAQVACSRRCPSRARRSRTGLRA